jgi:PAS domain S-box-containing protein
MSSMNLLSQQIQTMNVRILDLYKNAQANSKPDFVPIALKELGLASEELEVAIEEINRQNEALARAHQDIQAERLRYQNLFEFAPDSYLITDIKGTIQEVNLAAAALLNRRSQHLIGKPFAILVALEDRHLLRNALTDVLETNRVQVAVKLQYNANQQFDAVIAIDAIRAQGKLFALRWMIQDQRNRQQEAVLTDLNPIEFEKRSLIQYNRGEVIPLASHSIWLVTRGVVKLCSFTETGEEVLVGLAAEGMVFGTSLTSLPTYQAIAVSDSQVVAISLLELGQSPTLAHALVPLITQRLQQTERFLTIHGQIRVNDRLAGLLSLLAQEIGEPTAQGIRLKARLTHQDLANACSTTRVTITRLLNKFQEDGKIQFDSRSHLIIGDSL